MQMTTDRHETVRIKICGHGFVVSSRTRRACCCAWEAPWCTLAASNIVKTVDITATTIKLQLKLTPRSLNLAIRTSTFIFCLQQK
ncbi:hypothetical protein OOU_Y34scaffold01053g5 [Pyricularia oryzae Y34]|uniref:Uncharacterized protein n=1 Tax=Pyricularia oryzae (strain Y34) TaxID=1143189 RepID=A0AA97NMB3_PYRO3|nr:hypothetical protein OOU_Y34scaffold01053g5 [Pyricularia oryzae Y34]